MADLIDRDKVIEAIDDISVEIDEGYGLQYEKWRKYFCELPGVPRKGKWLWDEDTFDWKKEYICSECGCYALEKDEHQIRSNFCPSCGFRMEEGG